MQSVDRDPSAPQEPSGVFPRCRCGALWDTLTFYFGELSHGRPLCAGCLADLVEHAGSFGKSYTEAAARIQRKLGEIE